MNLDERLAEHHRAERRIQVANVISSIALGVLLGAAAFGWVRGWGWAAWVVGVALLLGAVRYVHRSHRQLWAELNNDMNVIAQNLERP